MRIGIITIPPHINYGGILQAYALQTVLERMGHEVRIIDIPENFLLPPLKSALVYAKRILSNLLGYRKEVFYEKRLMREWTVVSEHTMRFVNQYLHHHRVRNYRDLKATDFDAYVVGSDQVWRPDYMPKGIRHSYLDFAKQWNVRRVAYAASFGMDNWLYSDKETADCKRLLQLFDGISVREASGIDMVHKYFEQDALQVLDPTMLLDASDYMQLIDDAHSHPSKGNLVYYVLDNNPQIMSIISAIAADFSFTPVRANSRYEDFSAPQNERIQPPVEQWLRDFSEAGLVFTDSFHACVFSILFKKQFVVYGNEGRGMARFHSLLSMFGLEDRLVTSAEQAETLGEINYDIVYEKLETMREKSMVFLKNALN